MMNLNDALPAVIILVVVAIVTSFGATILTTFQADQLGAGEVAGVNSSYAYNVTEKGLQGLETIGNQQPNIALVVVAVIIIGLLVGSFAVLR